MHEFLVGLAVGVASTTDSDVFQKTEVPYLIASEPFVEVVGCLEGIGPDTADIVRRARTKCCYETGDLVLKGEAELRSNVVHDK